MSRLPSKLFFRIGEVASLVGVEPHVLRYWEREFRSIRPTKSAKGQRVYSRKDVENLLRVRDLLYRDGFTIAGAKKRLQRGGVENETESETENGAHDEPLMLDAVEREREEEEEVTSSGVPLLTSAGSPHVRVKLTALRSEVEAFLDELDTEAGDSETS